MPLEHPGIYYRGARTTAAPSCASGMPDVTLMLLGILVVADAYQHLAGDNIDAAGHSGLVAGKSSLEELFRCLQRIGHMAPIVVLHGMDFDELERRKQYPEKIRQYTDSLLLVGISYDRKTKQHTCLIERL